MNEFLNPIIIAENIDVFKRKVRDLCDLPPKQFEPILYSIQNFDDLEIYIKEKSKGKGEIEIGKPNKLFACMTIPFGNLQLTFKQNIGSLTNKCELSYCHGSRAFLIQKRNYLTLNSESEFKSFAAQNAYLFDALSISTFEAFKACLKANLSVRRTFVEQSKNFDAVEVKHEYFGVIGTYNFYLVREEKPNKVKEVLYLSEIN